MPIPTRNATPRPIAAARSPRAGSRGGQPRPRMRARKNGAVRPTGRREIAAQPSSSPTANGARFSSTSRIAAMLNMTATTWLKYQTEPTSATYHSTVPNPKTIVSPSRITAAEVEPPEDEPGQADADPAEDAAGDLGREVGSEDRHERDEEHGRERRVGDVPDAVLRDQLVQPRRGLGQIDPTVEERIGEADEVVEVLTIARRREQVDAGRDDDDDQGPERIGPAPDRVDHLGQARAFEPVDDASPE